MMAKSKFSSASVMSIAVSLCAMQIPGAAAAQESNAGPDANASVGQTQPSQENVIIVTARKREENIQEVPLTIQTFDEEAIDRYQIETLEDIEGLITGAEFIGDNGNPFANEIIIRGGGVGRQLNVDGGTGLYANGINVQGGNFGGRSLWEVDTFDVQRYEVLKGPQGALYGRNALGGAINVISRRPDLSVRSLTFRAGYRDNSAYSIGAFADVPLVEDVFGVRLAAEYLDQDDGFYFNPVRNEFIDQTEELNLRASARLRLGPDWEAHFQYDYYDTDREGDLTYDVVVNPDPFIRATDDPNFGTKEEESLYGSLRGDLGFGTLDLIFNHRSRDAFRTWDIDEGVAAATFDPTDQVACFSVMMMGVTSIPGGQRCTTTQSGAFERTSVEARLSGQTGRLDWIVGADWFESEDAFNQTNDGQNVNSFIFDVSNDVESISAFGGLEYAFTDRLSLGVEARVTSEDKNLASRAALTFGPVAGLVINDAVLDETFDYTTWTVFGSYKITDNVLGYLRAGSGFRTGGLNSDARDVDDGTGTVIEVPDSFDAERAVSYEGGIKSSWLDNSLVLNVSAYLVKYEDFISNANNGLRGLDRVSFVTNLGDAELVGVEGEGRYTIDNIAGSASLDLGAGIAYTSGEITDAIDPANNDLKISRVPEWSWTASANLDIPLNDQLLTFATASYSGQSGGFQTFSNNTDLPEPQLVNLQIGIRGDSWSLSASIRNLFDEEEPVRNSTPNNTISLAREPRTWAITLTKSFGG